jgi:hypothetical protein
MPGKWLVSTAAALLAVMPGTSHANFADCKNLYVARIYFNLADSRPWAQFKEAPESTSVSVWLYPTTGYTDRAYQQLFATLLTAKQTGGRVTIATDGAGGCSMASSPYLTAVQVE